MSTKEQFVISKLVAIADKQQSTLIKLAQAVSGTQPDPEVVKYLKTAWQTAALNSGVTSAASPDVTFNPSGESSGGATMGENYMLKGEIPANNRELFTRNFQNQIRSQRPDLEGRVSTVFTDPTKLLGASMNSRKVIERLFKIAQNQQKIINKLAQEANLAPQHLDPNKAPHMRPGDLIKSLLPDDLKGLVTSIDLAKSTLPGAAFDLKVKATSQLSADQETSIEATTRKAQQTPGGAVPQGNFTITQV